MGRASLNAGRSEEVAERKNRRPHVAGRFYVSNRSSVFRVATTKQGLAPDSPLVHRGGR
jgi:hypothetical protein